MKEWEELKTIGRRIAHLCSIQGLLGWDQETFMPEKAAGPRAEQLGIISEIIHKECQSKKFENALNSLIDIETGEIKKQELTSLQIGALKSWRKLHLQDKKLPTSFVKKWAHTTSTANKVWIQAKNHNDFSLFAPHLEKIVALSRKKADYLGYRSHPYDALLNLYEPDMLTSELTTLFSHLGLELTNLLRSIKNRPSPPTEFLNGIFSKTKQLHLSELVTQKMGLDPKRFRMDHSVHPFAAMLHPYDNRFTSFIHPGNFLSNFSSTLHEAGHLLYGLGFEPDNFGTPLARSISMGLDESQSRFWECFIGKSKPFWQYFYPHVQKEFPQNFEKIPLNDFYKATNIVEPSLIRVEADEVTYSLHIIIRFECEKALIEGSLKVNDLPKFWNERSCHYLGIVPETDADGCLQDIHWALGCFGYFPSYTLGNMYASSFFKCFTKEFPDWDKRVAKGDLLFIRDWLHEKIHRYGMSFTPREIMKKVTNKEPTDKDYADYLYAKYKDLYKLKDIEEL